MDNNYVQGNAVVVRGIIRFIDDQHGKLQAQRKRFSGQIPATEIVNSFRRHTPRGITLTVDGEFLKFKIYRFVFTEWRCSDHSVFNVHMLDREADNAANPNNRLRDHGVVKKTKTGWVTWVPVSFANEHIAKLAAERQSPFKALRTDMTSFWVNITQPSQQMTLKPKLELVAA